MMKHSQNIIVTFLAISLLCGCYTTPNLKVHIKKLGEINSNISSYENIFLSRTDNEHLRYSRDDTGNGYFMKYFNHKIQKLDTTIYLSYYFIEDPNSSESVYYRDIRFSKYYYKDDKYHMMELSNGDTLFHYTSLKPIESSKFFIDYEFIKGKYYFMSSHNSGFLNEHQIIYFFLNVDSLINVRGNNLPELPSIDTISLEDFYDSARYRKIVDEKSFFQ